MVVFVVERYSERYDNIYPYIDRGGIWFSILSSDIRKNGSDYKLLHNFSGNWLYGKVDVKKPFFIDVGYNDEDFYPLIMYHLLGQEPDYDVNQLMEDMVYRCGEEDDFHGECLQEEYAKKEKISSDILKRRGYDGVVFMKIVDEKEDLLQLFYVGNPKNVKWYS